METIGIKVNNCMDCPLCNSDNEYRYSCSYPDNEVNSVFSDMDLDNGQPPDNCPLRKESILIRY